MSSRFEYPIPGRAPSLLSMVETRAWPVAAQEAPDEAPAEEPARGWRVVSGMTLAGAVLGAAISFAWPQAYVATSEMLLNPAAMQAGRASSRLSPEASLAVVENQLRLLRSGVTLNAAVDRLNLAADAEFNGDAAGPFGVAGALANFGDLVAGDGAGTVEQRRRRAVERLAGAVQARQEPGSPVVSISVRTSDPEKSALIANTMSGLFLDILAGVPTDGTNLASLREELAAAERAVAGFRQENGLPGADEARKLARALETARDRTAALTAQVQTMNGLDTMATGSISPALPPQPVADALARQASAKRQVESLATRLGPRHPDLLTARADLDGAAREVDLQKQRLADALQEQLQQAEREQQQVASRLAGNGAEGEKTLAALRELERTAETRRAAYEDALSAPASAAPAAAGLRVLSRAEPPLEAAGPSTPMLTLAGALGGLLAGLGFTGWRRAERHDDDWEHHAEGEHHHHSETDWDADGDYPADAAYEAKETDPMYPYPPHASPYAQGQREAQPDQQPAGYAPQQMPMQAGPGWYPPMMQPPHDPWAQARGYVPQPAPYYGHPAYGHQPAPTVVYVPVPAHQQQQALPRAEHYERDRYMDRRTDAAIEEIRLSLRALREAIEDFADDRYGT